jgi:phage gpG-like protein
MDFDDLKKKFEKLAREAPAFMDNVAPKAVSKVAADLFKESFQKEGFDDGGWEEVNRRKGATYARKKDGKAVKNYAKGAATMRPILTGSTADLGRSIEGDNIKSTGGRAVVKAKFYGKFHNEGMGNLPKRQFMGQTNELNRRISGELDKLLTNFFNR